MFSSLPDRRRFFSAGLALLVQPAFLALLIQSLPRLVQSVETAKELTLVLPQMPAAPTPKDSVPPAQSALPRLTVPVVPFYVFPSPSLPNNTAAPSFSLKNLGIASSDCSPQNWSNLTPEKRAHCPLAPGAAVAILQAPDLLGSPSHVKEEAYWEGEKARKDSPPRLPCVTLTQSKLQGIGAPKVDNAIMFDMKCVVAKLATGTLTDPHAWPIYKTDQLTQSEMYKVDQAYDAWNKEHAPKPGN